MRRVAPILCLAFLSFCSGTPVFSAETPTPAEEIQKREQALFTQVAKCCLALECSVPGKSGKYYGAGCVVSPEGHILTASTAIPPGASEIHARFADGREVQLDELARDSSAEAVLLKVRGADNQTFPYLRAVDPEKAELGARVFAVGNPHRTLARDGQAYWSGGVLSGRYDLKSEDPVSRYRGLVLETTAAVNPGSDGGALIDENGRLLGLLSLSFARERWLGTAVPVTRFWNSFEKQLPVLDDGPAAAAHPFDALRKAAEASAPAVVRVHVKRSAREAPAEDAQIGVATPVADQRAAFERRMAHRPDGPVTGVLIDPHGIVLTSALNLADAKDEAEVELSNGKRYKAEVLGRDDGLDVAALKLELDDDERVPALELVREPGLRQGSFVCVLGQPPDKDSPPTCTSGIVSGLSRLDGYAHQLDARVNYGNSGGPVFDLRGRCVGLVAHVDTRALWAQSSGVGFFAPSERILEILPDLLKGTVIGTRAAPYLGVRPAINEHNIPGVALAEVVRDSAAWQAGLRGGDRILSLAGEATPTWPALLSTLARQTPGAAVEVEFVRASSVIKARAVLDAKK